jgi:hypothetical protein
MKSRVLWGLVGLNAVLLLVFAGRFVKPNTAEAQAQLRRPADYLMIPGDVQGSPTELVYVIDTTNGILGAMAYDDGSKTIQMMPSINLNAFFNPAPKPGQGRR